LKCNSIIFLLLFCKVIDFWRDDTTEIDNKINKLHILGRVLQDADEYGLTIQSTWQLCEWCGRFDATIRLLLL